MPKTDSQEDDGVEDEPYDPFMTVTVRDALLNEQQVSVAKAGNVFNLRDAYGAASGMHDYNLAWSFNGNELDTEGWSAGPFDLEDVSWVRSLPRLKAVLILLIAGHHQRVCCYRWP